MAYQGFFQHSGIFWLVLHISLLHLSASMTVHLNYTSPKIKGQAVPEELNITLSGESGSPTYLHLKRAHHINPNVPVITLNVDKDGKFQYHREKLDDKQNVGYYQDMSTEAVIEVTRVDDLVGDEAHLLLKGELNVKGKKYWLSPESRTKRDTSNPTSLSEDVPYSLMPQAASPVLLHDYVDSPPEVERKIVEIVSPERPHTFSAVPPSDTLVNNSSSSSPPPFSRRRRQSQNVVNIYIDIAAVADNAIYNRFLGRLGTKSATLQSMREYFAFIYNGVDLRYQGITTSKYKIRVRLVKLIIAQNPAASMFTEEFRRSSSPWDEIDAQDALKSFSDFAAGSGRDVLFPYDHAMIFTGYDITSTLATGAVSDSTTGLAYTSTLCRTDGKSMSIIEDLGAFQSVDTAAHELGHSLSALHDGDDNTCRSSDRYIMSSGGYPATGTNKLNSWIFSSCSIVAFNSFISNKLKTQQGKTCLLQQQPISAGVVEVGDRLPGQQYTADDQCRMIYGKASRLCRGPEFGSASDICTSMFCYDPSTAGTCYGHKATMGTTCGNGKLCLNGQCVTDSRAPAVQDNCVFGDQPGIAFEGRTCAEFINNFSGYCYQSLVSKRCCGSCQKVYTSISGCEYGDSVQGCYSSICANTRSTSTMKQCCGTCSYGAPVASTSTRKSITGSRYIPRQTVRLNTQNSTPATALSTASSTSCVDKDNILVNGQMCALAVRRNPILCYTRSVRDNCCFSCRRVRSGFGG